MHPHTLLHSAPVAGVRFNAPWGPTTRRRPIKPCRVRRYVTLNRAQFAYWQRTGEIWRHKRPPIMGGANLLTGDSANFDGGTIGSWTVGSNCTLAATTDQFQAGTHSLRVTATAAGAFNAYFSTGVVVSAGTSYIGSVYLRAAVTSRAVSLIMDWYTSADAYISSTPAGPLVADTTSGWTKAYVVGTAPATATRAKIAVSWGGAAAAEVHYLDTVSVDTTTPGDLVLYPATGTWRAASIAVDGFDITEAYIRAYGGGGGGGVRSGIGGITGGAGGGAGASAQSALTVAPDTTYTVTVGANGVIAGAGGDSWFSTAGTILAKGGTGASTVTPGTGGTTAASIGTTKFAGGNGAANAAGVGGGGGGGAGDANAGTNAAGQTGGAGGSFGGGAGGRGGDGVTGAGITAGSLLGGGGGGAGSVAGNNGSAGARGAVIVDPTKFRVQGDVVTEHVISVPRLLVAARSFAVITEHVLARTLNVAITHPVVTEHVTSQGAKSIIKTAFPAITEHVVAFARLQVAFRTFPAITEHVVSFTRSLVLTRSFPVITEHVTALTRRLVATRSFPVITEHDVALTRRLVASRTFSVISEHVLAFNRSLVASRSFSIITEHVTAFTRTLALSRTFPVITEHELSVTKILTFVRDFFVITEHVVTAAVCMDFDDVPGGACPPCDEVDVWGIAG